MKLKDERRQTVDDRKNIKGLSKNPLAQEESKLEFEKYLDTDIDKYFNNRKQSE